MKKERRGNTMKKARFIIGLLVALWLISACAYTTGQGVGGTYSPVLSRIADKGELVVGTAGSMPPLNMTTKEGQIIGFEIDMAQDMADAMGVKLRLAKMPFAELLPALESGEVDLVLSGMTMSGARNQKFAFVGPYFISGKSFLAKYKKWASVKDASEVNSPNTTLAALKGSTSQVFVETLIPKAKLIATRDYDEAVDMVLQDKVDALIADYPICLVSVFRYPNENLVASVTPITYEPIGIAMPGNDPLLVNWVENFLNTLEGSGELRMLRNRWFFEGDWLKKLP
jgi:polar amino acid transport system substrate-binding protein